MDNSNENEIITSLKEELARINGDIDQSRLDLDNIRERAASTEQLMTELREQIERDAQRADNAEKRIQELEREISEMMS